MKITNPIVANAMAAKSVAKNALTVEQQRENDKNATVVKSTLDKAEKELESLVAPSIKLINDYKNFREDQSEMMDRWHKAELITSPIEGMIRKMNEDSRYSDLVRRYFDIDFRSTKSHKKVESTWPSLQRPNMW